MNTLLLLLLAGGIAFLKYKKDSDKEYQEREKEYQKNTQAYLDKIDKLEDRINPNNDNGERLPVDITAEMKIGGGWLNQIEIVLHFFNRSSVEVELEDFRTELTIGGYQSLTVFPSNTASVKIPAGKKRDFILYKEDDYTFRGSHKEPYKALSMMAGQKDGTIPKGYVFAEYLYPAELNMAFLWIWKGGQEACTVYNLPCKVTFMGDNWGVNYDWVGYNAGNKAHQEANPSYWTKYDGEGIDIFDSGKV